MIVGSAETARITPNRSRSASGPNTSSIPAFACRRARSTASATAESVAVPQGLRSTISANTAWRASDHSTIRQGNRRRSVETAQAIPSSAARPRRDIAPVMEISRPRRSVEERHAPADDEGEPDEAEERPYREPHPVAPALPHETGERRGDERREERQRQDVAHRPGVPCAPASPSGPASSSGPTPVRRAPVAISQASSATSTFSSPAAMRKA